MVFDQTLLSACGRFCGNCSWFLSEGEDRCPCCNVHEGHPRWGECRQYSCAAEHGVEHCGHCPEFPCDFAMNYYDPGNPEGPRNAAVRVAVNAYRAKHGDEETLRYLERAGTLNKPVK